MSDVKLTFCIFSYNRGRFLRNCVDSIRACAPNGTTISIFDDDSDDPETLQYLAEAESHCEILKPQDKGTIKHGGLYLNMQLALEHYADAQLICFLQDDTQVVRPISEEEVNGWHALFSKDSNVGFVHPCFIRGVDQKTTCISLERTDFPDLLSPGYGAECRHLLFGLVHYFAAKAAEQSMELCTVGARERPSSKRIFYSDGLSGRPVCDVAS